MPDRRALSTSFLDKSGWANATRTHLAGDASNRSYQRLTHKDTGEVAVLMDAPPRDGENVKSFIAITDYLLALKLSAPRILSQDTNNGFLLIEDLGDALFARLIHDQPDKEHLLYSSAVDVLVELHQHPTPDGLLDYTPTMMANYIAPVFEWYHPTTADAVAAIKAELESVLTKYCSTTSVMALRDYHAENLLWLPTRHGLQRTGLLDYQDAVLAHPAYDLVSLLKDARRDVSPNVQTQMINRYIANTGTDPDRFRAAYSVQGAQRNLRILGIFARLCLSAGKPAYVDLIPRVWSHLQDDLSHPALTSLNTLVFETLPAPTPKFLQRLKQQCKNNPTP